MLFQPVEGEQVPPWNRQWLRHRACCWTSVLYLRFVLLQPVEGCQPLALLEWESTVAVETLELLEMLEKLDRGTMKKLELLALLESSPPLRQA